VPAAVIFRSALVLMLCCAAPALMADASAASVERITFDSAPQKLLSGRFIAGDPIQGDLAKPDGAGPFPAVVVLHGCGGMHEATKQRLVDHLVGWGYVALLVDSYATRGIQQACTSNQFATFAKRRQDAYGALAFLAGERFVDPQRVAAVGFSSGGWLALFVTEPNSSGLFELPNHLRFRAAVAFNPPCDAAAARPEIPALILIGALDDWTPAADCSKKVASWGTEGPPVELVIYPGAYHGFYYTNLQPGRKMFDHWLEYNGAAADDSDRRLRAFLDRYLGN
jgi:dienelactone hydrolase